MRLTTLAQTGLPENPLGYGILGLVVILWMTGWLYSRGAYLREVERGDKLEAALDKQREATLAALDGIREFKELAELLRRVLESLPAEPQPKPPTTTRRRTG